MVLQGSKYWLLIPPSVVDKVLLPSDNAVSSVIRMEAWQFFSQIHPYLRSVFRQNIDDVPEKDLSSFVSFSLLLAPPSHR